MLKGLPQLIKYRRQNEKLVKRVSDARDEGDLKENAGYHAARDELGKLDGRVQQLVDMLERAEVGETPADDGVVEPGMIVTVLLGGAEQKFLLGAREMAGGGTELRGVDHVLSVFDAGADREGLRLHRDP